MIPMTETGKTARMTASHQKRGPLKIRSVSHLFFIFGLLLRLWYSVNMVCCCTRRRSRWSHTTRSCWWHLSTLIRAIVAICWRETWRRSCTHWDCTFPVPRWTHTHTQMIMSIVCIWICASLILSLIQFTFTPLKFLFFLSGDFYIQMNCHVDLWLFPDKEAVKQTSGQRVLLLP